MYIYIYIYLFLCHSNIRVNIRKKSECPLMHTNSTMQTVTPEEADQATTHHRRSDHTSTEQHPRCRKRHIAQRTQYKPETTFARN